MGGQVATKNLQFSEILDPKILQYIDYSDIWYLSPLSRSLSTKDISITLKLSITFCFSKLLNNA
jgi:hypothetical protein